MAGDERFLGHDRYSAIRHFSRLDGTPRWSRVGIEPLHAVAPNSAQRRFKIPRIREILQARGTSSDYRLRIVPQGVV